MKSIYDMMGRYTYPSVRDEAPSEHVEKFFQVPITSTFMYMNTHNLTRVLRSSKFYTFLVENGQKSRWCGHH